MEPLLSVHLWATTVLFLFLALVWSREGGVDFVIKIILFAAFVCGLVLSLRDAGVIAVAAGG